MTAEQERGAVSELVEKVALAILNVDRVAGGWPEVESRDNIPDSEGYVRNAQAAIATTLDEIERHLSAVQYDPAPYTALKHRLAHLRREALG